MALSTLVLVIFIIFMMIWSGLNAILLEDRFVIIINTLTFAFNVLWLFAVLGVLKIAPAVHIVSAV